MSFRTKRELAVRIAPRYREVSRKEKTAILDEFIAATGYSRKYALRLMANPPIVADAIRRPRSRSYGPEVQDALATAWGAANFICAKRLIPFLPELVATLEQHGHLVLRDDVRSALLEVSAATADRILRPLRQGSTAKGRKRTSSRSLLKHRVPVRTSSEWSGLGPGFVEADCVSHCGARNEGAFLRSLVLTDVATGWTECLSLSNGGQDATLHGIEMARRLMPFSLLGIDTDNGTEFINEALVDYCDREDLIFTRGRPYRKNDQCYVEQKNG